MILAPEKGKGSSRGSTRGPRWRNAVLSHQQDLMQLQAYMSVVYPHQTAPVCSPRAVSATQTARPMPRRAASAHCSVSRQQQLGAQAVSAAASLENHDSSGTDSRHEQLLHTLTGYSVLKLRQHMHEHPNDVSLSFLQWLASR